ncbi:MAG: zinc metalloprotease HtpX [Candidatus Saccharicenans sp.]
MADKIASPPQSYWEIEKKQKFISVFLFLLLFLFYILTIGLITAVIFLSLGIFIPGINLFSPAFFYKYTAALLFISAFLTALNYFQARSSGANYILTNLRAYPPDPQDRYHLSFINIAEEMKISSGWSHLKTYIIPSINLNSLSLIDKENIPAIAVTEGLLAEATRDELQAVVAHEIAHIIRGDTFLLTLIFSLSAFYERLLDSAENKEEDYGKDSLGRTRKVELSQPLIYVAGLLSYLLILFFTSLISHHRELLADATAVELSRDPSALARIIYKAQVANSYVGDNTLYAPLFLVSPDSRELTESGPGRLFSSHPPVSQRLKLLSEMTHRSLKEIIQEVRNEEESRAKARAEIDSAEELSPEKKELIKSQKQKADQEMEKERIWLTRNSSGQWEGPYTLGGLISLPSFTPASRIKNIRENLEGRAKEFPQVRFALYNQFKNQPINQSAINHCPTCLAELSQSFYEGVSIKSCPVCSGKLVRINDLEKILARKEFTFSEKLKAKADLYLEAIMDPRKRFSIFPVKTPGPCPECGLELTVRPFSSYYLFPVEKCYHCNLIWFEADELEILQILVEKLQPAKVPNEPPD